LGGIFTFTPLTPWAIASAQLPSISILEMMSGWFSYEDVRLLLKKTTTPLFPLELFRKLFFY